MTAKLEHALNAQYGLASPEVGVAGAEWVDRERIDLPVEGGSAPRPRWSDAGGIRLARTAPYFMPQG